MSKKKKKGYKYQCALGQKLIAGEEMCLSQKMYLVDESELVAGA